MLIWDVAFASKFASKLQVIGRSKQSCPHFQENLCRNTLYRPRRERAKQGFSRAWWHLAGLPPVPHRAPAAAQAPDPASFPTAFPHKSPLPLCIPQLLPCSRFSLLSQLFLSAPLELHSYCSSSPSFSPWLERPGGMLSWDRMLASLHHTQGKDHFPCDGEGTHLMIYATSLHRLPLHLSAPDSQQSSHLLSLCPVSAGFLTV